MMKAKQTPEQEALDQQRVYDNAMAVQGMKAKRNAEAYRDIQRETEQSQGRYQANPILQQYLNSNPDVFRAATNAALQSGVPKQGSRFTGGISNEYQNILDDFARQHYMDFGQKEGRGIASLPTVGRAELNKSIRDFDPREYTSQNYGYVPKGFDSEYYASSNQDVVDAVGNSPFDLYQHFINYGQKEGRNPRNPLGTQQFAEGGQVMGGMQPMTPASENSGIASGMMPESSQQKGMQMMEQMAGQMEQVYSNLDNAEDIEDVINAMRGNQEPLSERYSELAGLVGPEDAKKTPESVLTVLQPTFQILQGVPDSGIAEAPMGGVEGSEGNFSQPSATEPSGQAEAVLAMSRGEIPVKADDGYSGDIPFLNQQAKVKGILGQMRQNQTTPPMQGQSMPITLAPALQSYKSIADLNPRIQKAYEQQLKSSPQKMNFDKELENRRKLFQEYLPEDRSVADYQTLFTDVLPPSDERTAEQILQERKEFMGDTGADSSEIQGYLALAQAGSELASNPGSLLQGLTKAAGPLAKNLSKIASEKSEREFEEKGAAFDLRQANIKEKETLQRDLGLKAVSAKLANEDKIDENQRQIIVDIIKDDSNQSGRVDDIRAALRRTILTTEVGLSTSEVKAANDNLIREYDARNLFEGKQADLYWKVNKDGSIDKTPITVRRTGQGLRQYENGDYKLIPEGYVPIADATQLKLLSTGGVDKGKVTPKTFVVPDLNVETGYKQVNGVFSSKLGFALTDSKTGKPQWFQDLPAGTVVGKYSDVVTVSATDDVGRTYITFTPPDGGQPITFLDRVKGERLSGTIPLEFSDGMGGEQVIQTPVLSTRTLQNAPTFAQYETIDGKTILKSGQPLFIPAEGGPEVDFARLDAKFIKDNRRKIATANIALNALRDLIGDIPYGGGLNNNIKRLISSNVSQFTPQAFEEWTRWAKTDRAKQKMALFKRNIQQSQALSDKYAMGEQFITGKLAPQYDVFTDPIQGYVYAQTLATHLQNQITELRLANGDSSVDRGRLLNPKTGQRNDAVPIFDRSLPKGYQSAYFNHFAADVRRSDTDTSKSFLKGTEGQFRILFQGFDQNKVDQFINTAGRDGDTLVMPASKYFGIRQSRQ